MARKSSRKTLPKGDTELQARSKGWEAGYNDIPTKNPYGIAEREHYRQFKLGYSEGIDDRRHDRLA